MSISRKQDRQGARTPADLERKWNFSKFDARFSELRNIAATAQKQAEGAEKLAIDAGKNAIQFEEDLKESISKVKQSVSDVTGRIDEIVLDVKNLEDTAIADISKKVTENEASITSLAAWKDGANLSISAIQQKADANEASILSFATWQNDAKKSISAIQQKADANEASILSFATWQNDAKKSISAIEQKANANEAKILSFTDFQTATSKSLTAIEQKADANEANITSLTEWKGTASKSLTTIEQKANANEANITLKVSHDEVTADFVIKAINGESSAKIKADRLDIYGETLDIHVKATNIDGTLQVGQLPSGLALTGDIPTQVSELANDVGYQDRSGVVQIMDDTITAGYIIAGLGATIGRWAIADELLCAYGQTGAIKVSAGLKPNQIITRRDDLIKGQTQATIISSGMMEIYREGDNFVMPEFARFYFGGYEYSLYVDFNDNNRVKAYNWGRYQTGQIPEVPEIGIEIGLETVKISFSVEWRDQDNGEVYSQSYNFTPNMTWYDICDRDDAFMIDSGAAILFNGDTLYFAGAEVTASDDIVEGGIYYTNY